MDAAVTVWRELTEDTSPEAVASRHRAEILEAWASCPDVAVISATLILPENVVRRHLGEAGLIPWRTSRVMTKEAALAIVERWLRSQEAADFRGRGPGVEMMKVSAALGLGIVVTKACLVELCERITVGHGIHKKIYYWRRRCGKSRRTASA